MHSMLGKECTGEVVMNGICRSQTVSGVGFALRLWPVGFRRNRAGRTPVSSIAMERACCIAGTSDWRTALPDRSCGLTDHTAILLEGFIFPSMSSCQDSWLELMGLPCQRASPSDVCKWCQAGNSFPVLNGLVKPLIEWALNGFIMNNNNSK